MSTVREAAAEGPLHRLPPEVVTRLLDGHSVLRSAAGGVFYRPGEVVGLHLVVRGLVRVSLSSPEGRQVTVRYARPGDVLGVPVVVRGSAPVTAQAVTDVEVAVTRAGLLSGLASRDPRVGLWLAEELAARVAGLLDEVSMNAFWPVRRRLARHLLDLAVDNQSGKRLSVTASHQELANHVGTVREVVARTLSDLRQAGLIAPADDGSLEILNPAALSTQQPHEP